MTWFAKAREFTPLQKRFLEELRDPANKGDLRACAEAAGYPKGTRLDDVIRGVRDEILVIAKDILAENAVKASMSLVRGIDSYLEPGVKDLAANAEKILDRVGIVKGENVKVETTQGRIAILPARKSEDD